MMILRVVATCMLISALLVGCGDDVDCNRVGNQPPCCEFFGHTETPEGRCAESFDATLLPDTTTDTAGDAGDASATCEQHSECASSGSATFLCCPGGSCDLGPCVSGPAPPPRCEDREPSESCGDEMVCVDDANCDFGTCRPDCRIAGDCEAEGLTCEGDICTFDCAGEGFAGCPAPQVCRENGQCGVLPCDTSSCGPAADCSPVSADRFSHRDDGCRPKACGTSADCPDGTFCIQGGCSEQPGMCGDATPPP